MKRCFTLISLLLLCAFFAGASFAQKHHSVRKHVVARNKSKHRHASTIDLPSPSVTSLYAGSDLILADSVLSFAQTLIGTPYREASSNPLYGFDCSGFVSYVFKHFSLKVPRSSSEYYNAGERVTIEDAEPGDVILFTGTKTHHPHSIGHIGIVCANNGGDIKFIHSTSGKEYGVTTSDFNDTYKRRFVQVIRLLKKNSEPAEQVAERTATDAVGK